MSDAESRAGRAAPLPLPLGGLLLWAWRQLTSMRTALVLLLVLAVAAVPGSVIPQSPVSPGEVAVFREANPELAGWYDRLGLFDVYSAPWFAAVYLLLMVSLVGCVIPRSRLYWRSFRANPPTAPRNLSRLPAHQGWTTRSAPGEVAAAATTVLGARRFRCRRYADSSGREVVSAQRGYLRELGNLVFHVSLLVVLLGVAYGSLFGFSGNVLVVESRGFSNAITQYDEFDPGAFFDPADLTPFSLTVDDFEVAFQTSGDQRGAPRKFDADLTYTTPADPEPRRYDLRVNEPLQIDDTSVFLVGHGYAPKVTVRDGTGRVAFQGAVPFLPQELATFTSTGVIKVPDARPTQLGLEGYFLPTFSFDEQRGPRSLYPDTLNPALVLTGYRGDLQMDSGVPQSVYELDKSKLTQLTQDGEPFRLLLQPGQTKQLPGGVGSITFDGIRRAVALQIGSTPAKIVPLVGVLAAIAGMVASLYVRPRRVWLRVGARDGQTRVELAALDRVSGRDLPADLDALAGAIRDQHEPTMVKEPT